MVQWYMISRDIGIAHVERERSAELGTPFQRSLGIRWVPSGEPGATVAVELELRPELCGPAGSLEGGVISTLVDVAGASAGALALRSASVATEHLSVSMLAPGRVGPVRATGSVLRAGRSGAVAEVRVVDRGQEDRLLAVALVTVRLLDRRAPATTGP